MIPDVRELWSRVRRDEPKAWRQLVELYGRLVYSVARRVGLSVPDAEDCAQCTWLALYRRRKSLKNPAGLPAWLIRTAHHQAVYLHRRSARDVDLDSLDALPDEGLLPDAVVERLERQALVEIAMRHLDPRCRMLLEQLYLTPRRRSYRQLARDLGLKSNAVGPLRSRCLARLQRILKKIGYEPD